MKIFDFCTEGFLGPVPAIMTIRRFARRQRRRRRWRGWRRRWHRDAPISMRSWSRKVTWCRAHTASLLPHATHVRPLNDLVAPEPKFQVELFSSMPSIYLVQKNSWRTNDIDAKYVRMCVWISIKPYTKKTNQSDDVIGKFILYSFHICFGSSFLE